MKWVVLREGDVLKSGTDYKLKLSIKSEVEEELAKILSIKPIILDYKVNVIGYA